MRRLGPAATIAGIGAGLVTIGLATVVLAWLPRASRPPTAAPAGAAEPLGVPALPPAAAVPRRPPAPIGRGLPPIATPPSSVRAMPPSARQRGIALGLFAEDVSFDYGPLLAEIAALGASHVALVVPFYQEHGASVALALHTRFSPSLEATAEAIRAARRRGLEVTLFPIVRLLSPRPGEWRGTLAPADRDAWFASYGELLGDHAALGQALGATRLVIGSELSTLDGERARWAALIERIRALFGGPLVYSANWDHFRDAALLDQVDEAGVVAYFELREKDPGKPSPSDVPALERRWRQLRAELEAWRARRPDQPFVFTEVGYRSRAGASATPWDETPGGIVDHDEQRRAFEAFRLAWQGATSLAGYYVWNWYGYGGERSLGYTPRGKPAAAEVERLLRAR
jgi:hypothetical protein